MYERFTVRALKVMDLASREAKLWNHEYVGTEHVLVGIVKEDGGAGAIVLRNLGVTLERLLPVLKKVVGAGPEMVTLGKLPQTPNVKKAIERTFEGARALGDDYIGTEHLLLGLVRETDHAAVEVLKVLKVTPEMVRNEIAKLREGWGDIRLRLPAETRDKLERLQESVGDPTLEATIQRVLDAHLKTLDLPPRSKSTRELLREFSELLARHGANAPEVASFAETHATNMGFKSLAALAAKLHAELERCSPILRYQMLVREYGSPEAKECQQFLEDHVSDFELLQQARDFNALWAYQKLRVHLRAKPRE